MRTNPKHNKNRRVNKTFGQSANKDKFIKVLNEALEDDKILLDLLSKNMSPNDIVEHFWNVKHVKSYSNKITKRLLRYKDPIGKINRKFDEIAGKKLKVSVIDETFKGRKIIILVFMDAITGYVFLIRWIKNRKKNTILKALEPYKDLLDHVNLVLTDGAPYFPELVREIFPNARHQTCLVHVMRGLYRKLEPFQKRYRSIEYKIKKKRKEIHELQQEINDRRYSLKCLKQQHSYHKQKRTELRNKFGVKPYQKNILGKYPALKEINLKINEIRTKIASMTHTLDTDAKKMLKLRIQLEKLVSGKNAQWGIYMKYCKYLHQFYDLFQRSGIHYIAHRQKLLYHLRKCKNDTFLKEIMRVLMKTKGLESVNTDGCPVILSRRFINTNAIESINSRIRPILDKLRKIRNGEYIEAIFDLVKLRLNTTCPRSGSRKNTSPIERLGYNLRGKTYLDLIIDGFPSGPQYALNSSEIDLELVNPNMLNECKIKVF